MRVGWTYGDGTLVVGDYWLVVRWWCVVIIGTMLFIILVVNVRALVIVISAFSSWRFSDVRVWC